MSTPLFLLESLLINTTCKLQGLRLIIDLQALLKFQIGPFVIQGYLNVIIISRIILLVPLLLLALLFITAIIPANKLHGADNQQDLEEVHGLLGEGQGQGLQVMKLLCLLLELLLVFHLFYFWGYCQKNGGIG